MAQGKAVLPPTQEQRLTRIIADHLRAATFILGYGVVPSNVEQGYICHRLIRRAVRCGHELGLPCPFTTEVARAVIARYGPVYPELPERQETIMKELRREEARFGQTLLRELREFQKLEGGLRQRGEPILTGEMVFRLFDTFGFPPNLTEELAWECGLSADLEGFDTLFKQHQERSRRANVQKFKGGRADANERTTHLLQ